MTDFRQLETSLDKCCGVTRESFVRVAVTQPATAPVSWLMAYGVAEGRKAVNFSEWAAYSPEQQRMLLAVSCGDATSGKMPGVYTLLHPEMRLSPQDVETICAAAR